MALQPTSVEAASTPRSGPLANGGCARCAGLERAGYFAAAPGLSCVVDWDNRLGGWR